MNTLLRNLLILSVIFSISGCRDSDTTSLYAKVYKSDESIQCESEGIPLEQMMLELTNAGIDVVCSQKGHDGLVRPAVCGAGTGNLNIYKINGVNQEDAEKLGFESVRSLSEYRDQKCE